VNASLDDLQKGYAIKRREWRPRLSPRARSTTRLLEGEDASRARDITRVPRAPPMLYRFTTSVRSLTAGGSSRQLAERAARWDQPDTCPGARAKQRRPRQS
jgi:hypothetical protein